MSYIKTPRGLTRTNRNGQPHRRHDPNAHPLLKRHLNTILIKIIKSCICIMPSSRTTVQSNSAKVPNPGTEACLDRRTTGCIPAWP